MTNNKNVGYGRALLSRMTIAKTAGKTFVVGKSALAYSSLYRQIFTNDEDGVVRYAATLSAAVSLCTASAGDQILLLPGHTETVSSATALNMSVAGVTVASLGIGSMRGTFTLDTGTDSTITVSADNVRFENVVFVANFAAVAALFTLTTAKDFQLVNCEQRDTDATHNFIATVVLSATSNANDGLLLDNNRINSVATSGTVKLVSFLGTVNRVTITNNKYLSLTTNAGAIMPVAAGKAVTDLYFLNNYVNVQNAAGTATGYLITANTAGTGFIDNNKFSALPTTPLLVTAARGFVYGINYHTDTADTSGYIIPAQDS